MRTWLSKWRKTDSARSILASILSILIGMAVGCVIVLIVAATSKDLSMASAWEGIRLIFGGLFSTGRTAAGTLTFGFNPTNLGNMLFRATPLIMTGLSVAVAFKTGLFNIGAPGQYLMGTMATWYSLRICSRWLNLDHCLRGWLFSWCDLGRDSRPVEGIFEHQRSSSLYYDELVGCKPSHLGV